MANRKVILVRNCKTPEGWRRYPVAFSKNGRVKPDAVIVGGTVRTFDEGYFQLRTYDGARMVYKNVGTNAAEALAARDRESNLLAAKESAAAAGAKIVEEDSRSYLRRAAKNYIQDAENRQATEAAEQARLVTDEFLIVSGKTFVDEVNKDDIYRFHHALRKRGCADRTVANKHARLKSFLRFAGVDGAVIPPAPKYDDTLPTTYTQKEIDGILKAADDYLGLVIELGLKCGLREQEIAHLEWSDIHWADSVLRVTSKPHWGFRIKDSEERDIPIPTAMLKRLKKRHKACPKSRLVVATDSDKPNGKLLRLLKRLANHSGMGCKTCAGCLKKIPECQKWTLHKLRRTYATTLLQNGVDLRTVQRFMGHSDLASTMRYLRPATSRETQSAVNAIWS